MDIQKAWEIENAVKLVDPTRDALYADNTAERKKIVDARAWRTDVRHFKYVRISAIALIKMVTHARSGGDIEVMGYMIGYVEHETFVVTDAIRLPVEGTETRVNAHTEADEYVVKFLDRSRQSGQMDNAVGWYHSHPGYGCWLSGIDVSTQETHQTFEDPYLAVVIDPHRTISAGKVEIGAFRTYPKDHKPEGKAAHTSTDGSAAVPSAKAQDFGAHAHRYYPLEISHYKSTLDSKLLEALWNKYWVQTLSSSPLFANRDYVTAQIEDVAAKTKQAQDKAKLRSAMPALGPGSKSGGDERMAEVVKAAGKIAGEEKSGLLASVVKERIFTVGPSGKQPQHDVQEGDTQMAGS